MKKFVRCLFILTLCSTALSGCDFFGGSNEEVEAEGLELRDYKTAAAKGSKYEFSGKAYLKYSENNEVDVTSKCSYTTLDTSKLGSAEYKVSYETTKFIYSKTIYIKIVDKIKLESIEVKDYTTSLTGTKENYTFDGKVIAKYTDSTTKDVTKQAKISVTDKSGNDKWAKNLYVSYTEGGVTKSETKDLELRANLTSLSISGYTPNFEVKSSGTKYNFDGTILAKYEDNSSVDVTSKATLDTSAVKLDTIGTYPISASFTEGNKTVETSVNISVTAVIPKLEKIAASDYTKTVDKNGKYEFDGKVTATFDDGNTADVTSSCSFSTISTTTAGNKTLTITYKDVSSNITRTCNVVIEVISKVTGISAPTEINIAVTKTKTISASVLPIDANNKGLTFISSDSSIAEVDDNGLVTAHAVGAVDITITSQENSSITATTKVIVSETVPNEWTILIYMCGADLESNSQSRLATGDIKEILSVKNQPTDVNIAIQTGGAKSWATTYGINSSYNQRWHVENKSLVKDVDYVYTSNNKGTYKSMGDPSTLQDFVEWGINTYPAQKTGLIFWNHGGAMSGVCFDEKKSNDSLLTNEVTSAVSGALNKLGMSGEKLEFVGYDACLMQVQDIASMNADYFNYMIASEESEAGEGWDYDTWIDDLYAKKTTPEILQAICDGFISDNGGTSSSNDQTLSYLNLSQMDAYVTAWEDMAAQLANIVTKSNRSSFNTLVQKAKHYADSDYVYYGIFDAKDFVNKLSSNSTFNPGSSYTNAVLTAFGNLVGYSKKGGGAGNSNGLCMFWSVDSNCEQDVYYQASMTKFTQWRSLVSSMGY